MLESPCLEEARRLKFQKVKSERSYPLIYKIGLGLEMLGYSVDALSQPIRQLAPIAPPTHGLVHLIQHLETSSQP